MLDTGFDKTKGLWTRAWTGPAAWLGTRLDKTKGMVDSGVDKAKHLLYSEVRGRSAGALRACRAGPTADMLGR